MAMQDERCPGCHYPRTREAVLDRIEAWVFTNILSHISYGSGVQEILRSPESLPKFARPGEKMAQGFFPINMHLVVAVKHFLSQT